MYDLLFAVLTAFASPADGAAADAAYRTPIRRYLGERGWDVYFPSFRAHASGRTGRVSDKPYALVGFTPGAPYYGRRLYAGFVDGRPVLFAFDHDPPWDGEEFPIRR